MWIVRSSSSCARSESKSSPQLRLGAIFLGLDCRDCLVQGRYPRLQGGRFLGLCTKSAGAPCPDSGRSLRSQFLRQRLDPVLRLPRDAAITAREVVDLRLVDRIVVARRTQRSAALETSHSSERASARPSRASFPFRTRISPSVAPVSRCTARAASSSSAVTSPRSTKIAPMRRRSTWLSVPERNVVDQRRERVVAHDVNNVKRPPELNGAAWNSSPGFEHASRYSLWHGRAALPTGRGSATRYLAAPPRPKPPSEQSRHTLRPDPAASSDLDGADGEDHDRRRPVALESRRPRAANRRLFERRPGLSLGQRKIAVSAGVLLDDRPFPEAPTSGSMCGPRRSSGFQHPSSPGAVLGRSFAASQLVPRVTSCDLLP